MRSAAAAALLLLCCGCQLFRSDVPLIDYIRESKIRRPPVVIIPGILGSLLADKKTGEIEWVTAAPAFELARRPRLGFPITEELARRPETARDDLLPVGLLGEIPVVPLLYTSEVYNPLVRAFVESGYKIGNCDFPRADENAFIFSYDFRRDSVAIVKELALAIERIRDTRENPDEKVILVAHSFGGLLARYYLMYGERDVLGDTIAPPTNEGAANVDAAVFLGTPHRGAVSLLEFVFEGYGYLYNGQLITSDDVRTMPATYQLLPSPGLDCFLDGTDETRGLRPYRDLGGLPLNVYDPNTWVAMDWLPLEWQTGDKRNFVEAALARGLLWWTALEAPWSPPEHLRLLNIGGTAIPTFGRAVIVKNPDAGPDRHKLQFALPWSAINAGRVLVDNKVITIGDGRVTLESSFDFPHGDRIASTVAHDFVHHDPSVLANIVLFAIGEELLHLPAVEGPREVHR